MTEAVPALLADATPEAALAAGFEEEGVPVRIELKEGSALELAAQAARSSALGIGVGGDADRLVVALAVAPGHVYLEAPVEQARAFAQAAARVAARRPLCL